MVLFAAGIKAAVSAALAMSAHHPGTSLNDAAASSTADTQDHCRSAGGGLVASDADMLASRTAQMAVAVSRS